jgi:DNA primase
VGYVPSIRDLLLHLTNEIGYPVAEVQDLITDTRIGDSHRLAIPYRDPSGRIRGMVFRTTTGADPKYLYSAGLEKKTILFNLKAITGTKDLVIVEGVLDALHATAAGMANVVAIGGAGSALTKEHVETAIKYGAKKLR